MTGQRYSPRALFVPGGVEGKYVLDVDANGLVTGARRLVAGSNMTFDDTAPGELSISSTAAGGGGGGTGKDRRWNAGAAETSIDEFSDDSLAGAWVRVDGTGAAAGNVDWTESADTLTSGRIAANTGNVFQGIVRAISGSGAGGAVAAGDAWITALTQLGPGSTNFMMSGIVITDGTTHGAGKQVLAEVLCQTGQSWDTYYSVATSNWTTLGGTSSTSARGMSVGTFRYLRLVYLGSNVWRTDVSPSGTRWIKGAGTVTLASFTPTHVGFYSRDGGSGTANVTAYEFLRRVSGVT